MPRPSRNVDAALLRAGQALYPLTGARGLSVRKLAERAGVNVAMFHYHFGSKENFLRVLLGGMYERMFGELALAADGAAARPVDALRDALLVVARFVRDHRAVLRRILLDALAGEPVALEFARGNLPRHLQVVVALLRAGQANATLRPLPPGQALAFVAGAIGAPILLGTAISEHPDVATALRRTYERQVLSDEALGERGDLVMTALTAPARVAPRRRRA
jgi:AcrR family transcriptional regulator